MTEQEYIITERYRPVCYPDCENEKHIRKDERDKVLDIITSGKSALYELCPDGDWSKVLQAKMDVLCWIEEKLRQEGKQEEK